MRAVAVSAKELRYAVDLTAGGELTDENGVVLEVPAGVVARAPAARRRSSAARLQSLRHHAERGDVDVRSASGSSRTLVTKREPDDRYALVETEVELAVELEPEPAPDALAELLALAERDCFVGSSLTAEPSYRWIVNGRGVDS